ncbi:hydantoin racemase [bacterium]|nr:hydantoin racemase [bacterium]
MNGMELLLQGFGILVLGAIITALLGKWNRLNGWMAFILGSLASVLILIGAVQTLISGDLPSKGSGIFSIFFLDKLSSFFLLVISGISIVSLLYSIRYIEHYRKSTSLYYPFLLLFILGMGGVVSVRNMFAFLLFWEFMTLTSYFLVIYESEKPENLLAGFRYFFWSFLSAGCIELAVALLYIQTNSFDMNIMKGAMPTIQEKHPFMFHSLLALFLVGFGIKAGIFPFGNFWLPDAHPAAPSPVSALLSGVMIKTGVYGILRTFLWMLPLSPASNIWGSIIAAMGAISLVMGTLSALEQTDSKRLLAFHSIGQMGYIFLGVGAGLALLSLSSPFGYFALFGGLLHLFNHSIFKSLLFLSAGSILYKKGTRELSELGGLASSMPLTFFAALTASFAIGGIPPLNGFVSKWLLVFSTSIPARLHYEFPIWAIASIFASGLTIASMLKYVGSAFMGLKKEEDSYNDVPLTMQISQILLAAACLITGIVAVLPLGIIHNSLKESIMNLPPYEQLIGTGIEIAPKLKGLSIALWNPMLILLSLIILSAIFYEFIRGAKKETVIWLGGVLPDRRNLVYDPHSYFLTLRRGIWSNIPSIPLPRIERLSRLSVAPGEDVYEPLIRLGHRFIERLRKVHSGLLQTYILWQMLGLAIALLLIYAFK